MILGRLWPSAPESRPQGLAGSPRRVALGATVVVLLVYLAVVAVADIIVLHHFEQSVDARLNARLASLSTTLRQDIGSARQFPAAHPPGVDGDGDLDDAPVFGWFLPAGKVTPLAIVSGAPALPGSIAARPGALDVTLAGRPFRVDSIALRGGRLIAATSVAQFSSLRSTYLVTEGALLPFVLLTFFLVAYVIGRRAVRPVERSRQRQLDFTADASHELRTPLSVIEAEVGVALSRERSDTEYRAALERVGQESLRLRSIVEDLLWLARLDGLPVPSGSEPADLAAIAATCTARFAAIAEQRHLLVCANTLAPGAVVRAPAEWLERLTSVLVDNACRYSSPGGEVQVTVELYEGRAILTVDDSGPGIAEEERERIFQRFHRASFAPGGAGLGLSIADTVVRATDGRWEVGNSPTGGARMRVSWAASPFEAPDREALAGHHG